MVGLAAGDAGGGPSDTRAGAMSCFGQVDVLYMGVWYEANKNSVHLQSRLEIVG